ncbi:response regulator [bacterium endosymbiont of Escarpia laminata]|nr:MAG: response regulator [bacterium endosymbiont of Escarpia laminata]
MRTLTSGEVAKYCGVNLRTVIRWIEKGHLKSFKLPGRGNNRIQLQDFLNFMAEYGIPLPEEYRDYSRRILVVDDERPMANSIQRVLRVAGYETQTAYDGFQAGDAIRTFLPAVMTLDLSMPGLDGLKVIEYVKSDPALSRLKILVISALPENKLNEALAAGADDVLSKPFEKDVLITKVAVLLSNGAQRGRLESV